MGEGEDVSFKYIPSSFFLSSKFLFQSLACPFYFLPFFSYAPLALSLLRPLSSSYFHISRFYHPLGTPKL